jgi:spermidine synthase
LAADLPLAGDELIGVAWVPDGVELRLLRNEDDFAIVLERNELMSSDLHASEQALATMTCERLETSDAPQLLIGGYGMGFTLRSALQVLGPDASITLAEIVPEILDWARGPMRELTAGCLDDPRVLVMVDDVAMLIDAARDAYDAILLDVDNGPEGLTRALNDGLYSNKGLKSAMRALKPRGLLAVWSADGEPAFTAQLQRCGFEVSEVPVCARPDGTGDSHIIWFARKP